MYLLNLGLNNRQLYKGCRITEFEPGRFRLETPIDSAVVMVAANLMEILASIPKFERDLLVVTGAAPQQVLMTVLSIIAPHFKSLEHLDGNRKLRIRIPRY